MATSPHLSRKIRDTLGDEAGQELIGVVDTMAGDISDLRGDVAELRHQMELGFARTEAALTAMSESTNAAFALSSKGTQFRLAEVETRFDGRLEALGRTFERELRKQTQFFFVAWAAMLAAIIGLYAR